MFSLRLFVGVHRHGAAALLPERGVPVPGVEWEEAVHSVACP
jgi:hypothetical protein